jgi:SAM-dependent methyltransferase
MITKNWEYVNCNLCGVNKPVRVCNYNEIKIVRCKDCGLIYRNPRLKEEMNREFYSLDYYGEYEGMEERISNARLGLFRKVLLQLDKEVKTKSRRLLDVGCGQGHFLKMAQDAGWQVEGVELAKSVCDYAQKNLGIEVMNKSLKEASFRQNLFDVVTLWNVLDHLLDPLSTLKEIRRILKPEGVLVIRIPNVYFHLFIHTILSFLPSDSRYNRLRDISVVTNYGFSPKTIMKVLGKAGFNNVKVYNSPLSFGDPYKSFAAFNELTINFIKNCYCILAELIFYLTFKSCLLGSSLLIYAS